MSLVFIDHDGFPLFPKARNHAFPRAGRDFLERRLYIRPAHDHPARLNRPLIPRHDRGEDVVWRPPSTVREFGKRGKGGKEFS